MPRRTKKASEPVLGRSCARKECPKPYVCHPIDKTCVRRGDLGADLAIEAQYQQARRNPPKRVPARRRYDNRSPWNPDKVPGTTGFNTYAYQQMERDGVVKGAEIACPVPGRTVLQAYQKTVSYLVHPDTTVNRMLVAHRTGAGKTLTMIKVLQNFYNDPRPKVVIFPNDKVRNNFYTELMHFTNPYRTYALKALKKKTFDEADLEKVIDILALKGHPSRAGQKGYLAAPLRAMRYTIAGGSTVFPSRGRPSNPIFARGYNGRNPFDNKIIVMDEFHNLTKPDEETKKYQDKLRALQRGIERAQGSVIVGLTATPLVDAPEDVDELMRIIKGDEYRNAQTDEGFISYFQSMPHSVFPATIPARAPDGYPMIRTVTLQGQNLKVYNAKVKSLKGGIKNVKMLNYCDMAQSYRATIKPDSKFGKLLREEPYSAATKLATAVDDIFTRNEKTLVICHRENGFRALETLMEVRSGTRRFSPSCKNGCWTALYEKPTPKDEMVLAGFNSGYNARGEQINVMLVDSKFYSEGVSFKAVRRIVLVDVPRDWAAYKQLIGRALRFCGHRALPKDEWNVTIELYMAEHPNGQKTADMEFYESLHKQRDVFVAPMTRMANVAVDGDVINAIN
ncbi:MAG: hypothetical protein CMK92_03810 [Pseudomonas sp.]|nr:hypothetical protein [Pseudomonas sp.]